MDASVTSLPPQNSSSLAAVRTTGTYSEAAVELDDVGVRQARHHFPLCEHERRLVFLANEALVHHFDREVHLVFLHTRMEDLQRYGIVSQSHSVALVVGTETSHTRSAAWE